MVVTRPAAFGLLAILAGLAAGAFYLLYPIATVVLHPAGEVIRVEVDATIDPAAAASDPARRLLPARRAVASIELLETVPATGMPEDDDRLGGAVTLTNRTNRSLLVPSGSEVVAVNGARFLTQRAVVLEGTATARVEVRALRSGDAGIAPRLAIVRLDGPLTNQVAVLNEEPTAPLTRVRVVTAVDRERARAFALERARLDGAERLRTRVGPGEDVLADAVDVALTDEQWDEPVGAWAASVSYRATARATGPLYERAGLERIARAVLGGRLPPGLALAEGATRYGRPRLVGADGTAARVRMAAVGVAVVSDLDERAAAITRGRTADEARAALRRELDGRSDAVVTISPWWAARALRVAVRVDVDPPPEPTASSLPAGRDGAPGRAFRV